MKYTVIGIAKKMLGDETGAREAFLTAKRFAEKYVSEAPNDAARHSKLAGFWPGWEKKKPPSRKGYAPPSCCPKASMHSTARK